MTLSIEDAILVSVAREGSLSSVEKLGFTSAQIAGAIRQLLKEGRIVRNESKFMLGEGVSLPSIKRGTPKFLEPLSEYAVEKIDDKANYLIEHQTFTQIRERVRTQQ